MSEIRPIKGYEGKYSVTDDGRIYSHKNMRFIKPRKHTNGYLATCLVDDRGKSNYYLIHRIVCEAFNGEPHPGQTDVNHIDCDKKNNRADNLEWCTRSENMRHARENGLTEPIRKAVVLTNRRRATKVVGRNADGDIVAEFDSVTAAREAGYAKVSDVLLGSRKTAGGLIWERA